jgi:hypothetical protein
VRGSDVDDGAGSAAALDVGVSDNDNDNDAAAAPTVGDDGGASASITLPTTSPPSGYDVYFALGDNGTGVSFHFHAETMLLLHGGRKRWFLYPPATRPIPRYHDPSGLSRGGWTGTPPFATTAYSEPLWVCDQEAGDAVYLPSGWHHATVNFGATFGVALQVFWKHQPCLARRTWLRIRDCPCTSMGICRPLAFYDY